MEILALLFFLLLGLSSLAIFIGGIVFIARDAGKHNQSVALWVILFLFFGVVALAIYLFVTGRIGWGIFWLIGYPFIIGIIVFVGFVLIGIGAEAYLVAPFFL